MSGIADELLSMQRSMNRRLEDLQQAQSKVVHRLAQKVADANEILRAAREVVKA